MTTAPDPLVGGPLPLFHPGCRRAEREAVPPIRRTVGKLADHPAGIRPTFGVNGRNAVGRNSDRRFRHLVRLWTGGKMADRPTGIRPTFGANGQGLVWVV